MNAIVNGARSRSTMLTGAAGLLLLGTAVVMMFCAAPRIHGVRAASSRLTAAHSRLASPRDQLTAWAWTTPRRWVRVTPAPAGERTRTGRAPTP
jgi:hypothetical protein